MKPSLDQWTSIFLLAAAQGFFLAFILFFQKKGLIKANRVLAIIIFLFSCTLVHYVAYWSHYLKVFPHLIASSNTFPFLFGVLFWWYLRLSHQKELKYVDSLHLLPFLSHLAFMLPFYIQSGAKKLEIIQNQPFSHWQTIIIILQNISLLAYALLAFKELQTSSQRHRLSKILYAYTGFALSFMSYYVLAYSKLIDPAYDYAISFAMSFFIYGIGYWGYQSSKHFFEHMPVSVTKYEKSGLNHTLSETYSQKLLQFMELHKPYLDSELRMNQLADNLGMTVHHLSQVINEKFEQSYSDFINAYRIKAAQEQLLSTNAKIIDIVYDSGFNNKVSFNNAFKKLTGFSPSEYRRIHSNSEVKA